MKLEFWPYTDYVGHHSKHERGNEEDMELAID